MVRASKSKSKSVSRSVEPVETDEMEVEGEEVEDKQQAEEGEEEQDAEAAGGDEEEDEEAEEESEGEYEVEAILEHRPGDAAGKFEYLVSWKGYGPEHNTWEPQGHLDHADNLVSDYWASKPKKSIKTESQSTKRGRSSGKTAAPPAKSARPSANRPKRKSPDSEDDEEMPEVSHHDDLAKYIDIESWENLVASVDTVERGADGTLMVYVTMTGGEKGAMATEVIYKRCPQKMLAFYEAHLKWRAV